MQGRLARSNRRSALPLLVSESKVWSAPESRLQQVGNGQARIVADPTTPAAKLATTISRFFKTVAIGPTKAGGPGVLEQDSLGDCHEKQQVGGHQDSARLVSWRAVAAQHHLAEGDDGITRCWWAGTDPLYVEYHDTEWGFPVTDDLRLYEKLSLEGFQAGLSWLTILRKRENFRGAFAGFDYHRVAHFGEPEIARLLDDAGIVRHRGKIEATINNASRALDLVAEFGSVASYVWSYAPDRAEPPTELPSITPESTAMSRDLKRRGWKFVGPTTVYAFMQAMGLVNDHLAGCAIRPPAERARKTMLQP